MNAHQKTLARRCLESAESNTMTFSEIVGALIEGGFEGYTVDFRRSVASYYLPTSDSVEFQTLASDVPVSPTFDAESMKAAIREAQTRAPGYTYGGFCAKARTAGCAGYMVSFSGRRAVYFGRTGETHVELFPSPA
jgi:uncharacterized protein YbcV (DUF1398 family)